MAEYTKDNFNILCENPMFVGFAKRFGFENLSAVSEYEQEALVFAYRYSIHTSDKPELNDEEKKLVEDILNKPNDEIKTFAQDKFNKPYEELEPVEKVFAGLAVLVRYNRENERNGDEIDVGGKGRDGNEHDNNQFDDLKRIRSAYSDSNEQWIRWEKLASLKEMGIVSEELPERLDTVSTVDLMLKYEPNLSEKQVQEMTEKVTDKILENEVLFESTPPSVLAAMYNDFKQKLNSEKDEEKRKVIAARLNKVADRIDNLTEMVAKDKELYFADPTNIADAYRAYNAMFIARFNDLMDTAKNGETDEEKAAAGQKLQYQHNALDVLEKRITEYDNVYNLSNVSAEKADELDKRFELMRKTIEGVEISPETAKLVANFKFLDREYFVLDPEQLQSLQQAFPDKDFSEIKTYSMLNPDEVAHLKEKGLLPKAEPQFVDKDGKVSTEYSEGAKVIPGSKLDKAILAAKQSVMLTNLGTDAEITPEFLQKELDAQLPKTLYTLHIVDLVNQGVAENPNQFTKQEYIDRFIADLGNTSTPMAIGPISYEAGIDNIVNQTGGYAERLVQRLSNDKDGKPVENPNIEVATKLFEPIASIDKNAKDRTVTKQNGKQNYWKNVGKTFLSAATMSCAMRLVGTAAQSATGIAWAGAGIGSVLGVGLTAYQINKWNKERKAAGLSAGFKDFVKDRRMMMTVATTTLGCAATACMAVPGMQPVGLIVGGCAMAVGAANGAITAYKAARASGDNWWKACAKAVGIAGAAGLGAFAGMKAADFTIDQVNTHFKENEIFQHKETIKVSDGTEETTRTVVDRKALETDANRYNEQYNISDRVHPGMSHDDYMNAVKEYNNAHPDAKIFNPDELLKHAFNAQNGRVYGPGYVAVHGLDPDVVRAVGNLINSDGTINPDAVKAWNGSDLFNESGLQNFVRKVPDPVESRPDLYPTRDPNSTYSDTIMPKTTETIPGTDPVYEDIFVANNKPSIGEVFGQDLGAPAMLGVMGSIVSFAKMVKKRVGSLLDRTENDKVDDNPPVRDDNPPHDKGGKEDNPPHDKGGNKDNPPHNKDNNDRKPIIVPAPKNLLIEEFNLVRDRNIKKETTSDKEFIAYKKLVVAEYNQARENGETKADFQGYLEERKKAFEAKMAKNLGVENLEEAKPGQIRETIKNARALDLLASTANGEDKRTLLSFGEALSPKAPKGGPVRQNALSRTDAHTH